MWNRRCALGANVIGLTSIVLDLLEIPYGLDVLYVYMFIRDLAGATRCHLSTFR
jgi:hypothetical protein